VTITDLRGFLGLTGYYRRFMHGYGVIAQPLTRLLKKGAFKWTPEQSWLFRGWNKPWFPTPVLALPNFNIPFAVETDACGEGVGTVLMQKVRPIAFLSKTLGVKNQKLSIYEKESLLWLWLSIAGATIYSRVNLKSGHTRRPSVSCVAKICIQSCSGKWWLSLWVCGSKLSTNKEMMHR
jgi:hypothetical protein